MDNRERPVTISALPSFIRHLVLWLLLIVMARPELAQSEWMIGIHGGASATHSNDVHLVEADDTDLMLRGVQWYSQSFGSPPYYGVRIVKWFGNRSAWGVGVDFTHTMMIAELKDTVELSGTLAGLKRSGKDRLWNTFGNLQFSNGHSMVTANLFYRRPTPAPPFKKMGDRLSPYAGVGLGLATPHAEVATAYSKTSSYQIGGIAVVANAGAVLQMSPLAGLFVEYRMSRATIDAELEGNGSLSLVSWTHHGHLGLVFYP